MTLHEKGIEADKAALRDELERERKQGVCIHCHDHDVAKDHWTRCASHPAHVALAAMRERADVAERIVKAYDQAVLECADSQDTHVAGPGDVRTIAFRRDQALADRDALASRVTELEAAVTSNRSEIARMVTERDALAAKVERVQALPRFTFRRNDGSEGFFVLGNKLDAALATGGVGVSHPKTWNGVERREPGSHVIHADGKTYAPCSVALWMPNRRKGGAKGGA